MKFDIQFFGGRGGGSGKGGKKAGGGGSSPQKTAEQARSELNALKAPSGSNRSVKMDYNGREIVIVKEKGTIWDNNKSRQVTKTFYNGYISDKSGDIWRGTNNSFSGIKKSIGDRLGL